MSAPVAQTRPLHTFKSAHTRTLAMNRMSPLELFGQLPVELRLIILTAFPNIFVGGENYALLKDGSVKKNKRNIDIWFTRNFESYAPKEIHTATPANDGMPCDVKTVWKMVTQKGLRGKERKAVAPKTVYAQLKPSEAIGHPDWERHSKRKFSYYVVQKQRCSETSPFDDAPRPGKRLGARMFPDHFILAKDFENEDALRIYDLSHKLGKKYLNTPKRVKDILSGAKTLTYKDFLNERAILNPDFAPFINQPFEWFYEDGTPITQLF